MIICDSPDTSLVAEDKNTIAFPSDAVLCRFPHSNFRASDYFLLENVKIFAWQSNLLQHLPAIYVVFLRTCKLVLLLLMPLLLHSMMAFKLPVQLTSYT